MTNFISDYIKRELKAGRNFTCLFVGRPGTGKTYSAIRLCEQVDSNFTSKSIVFKVEDLLDLVKNSSKGDAILFDEAAIAASNRQSYMNKYNKAFSFLLQTFRHRQIVLVATMPDLRFLDAGCRRLFNALFESKKVRLKMKKCDVQPKLIENNPQTGKEYYKYPRTKSGAVVTLIQFGKPHAKILKPYERRKHKFTKELYDETLLSLQDEPKPKGDGDEERRCPDCKTLGRWYPSLKKLGCLKCGSKWERVCDQKDASV